MPCTEHSAICNHLQEQLRKLGSEKGDGPSANAATAAFHSAIFDVSHDWRGLQRVRAKEQADMETAVDAAAWRMREAAALAKGATAAERAGVID